MSEWIDADEAAKRKILALLHEICRRTVTGDIKKTTGFFLFDSLLGAFYTGLSLNRFIMYWVDSSYLKLFSAFLWAVCAVLMGWAAWRRGRRRRILIYMQKQMEGSTQRLVQRLGIK